MFGKDKIKNAVHCSDLPEDGLIEVRTLFLFVFFFLLDQPSVDAFKSAVTNYFSLCH